MGLLSGGVEAMVVHRFQCLYEQLLTAGKEMRIDIQSRRDMLVTDTLRDSDGSKSLIDE